MNLVMLALTFLVALVVAAVRGPGFALSVVYLPSLLLLANVTPYYFSVLSIIDVPGAALYGILIGALGAGHLPRFRPTWIDALVFALMCTHFASSLQSEPLIPSIRMLFTVGMKEGLFLYFFIRSWLHGRAAARGALVMLPLCMGVVLLFALIEARLWPHTYSLILHSFGLIESVDMLTLFRLGFFRAQSTFAHPIDLGNSAALAAVLYVMLVWREKIGMQSPVRLAVLGGWLLSAACAISFSSFALMASGLALFVALFTFPVSRRLMPLVTIVIIAAGYFTALRIANEPTLYEHRGETPLEASYRNRQELIKQSWDVAATSGPLGWGTRLEKDGLVTRSVDNAHLLLAMRRGWIGLGLWLAIPLVLSWNAARLRGSTRSSLPLRASLLGVSAVIGTMISMFTVFFGFVYAPLFMIVLALTVSVMQEARRAHAPARRRRRRARAATEAGRAAPVLARPGTV